MSSSSHFQSHLPLPNGAPLVSGSLLEMDHSDDLSISGVGVPKRFEGLASRLDDEALRFAERTPMTKDSIP